MGFAVGTATLRNRVDAAASREKRGVFSPKAVCAVSSRIAERVVHASAQSPYEIQFMHDFRTGIQEIIFRPSRALSLPNETKLQLGDIGPQAIDFSEKLIGTLESITLHTSISQDAFERLLGAIPKTPIELVPAVLADCDIATDEYGILPVPSRRLFSGLVDRFDPTFELDRRGMAVFSMGGSIIALAGDMVLRFGKIRFVESFEGPASPELGFAAVAGLAAGAAAYSLLMGGLWAGSKLKQMVWRQNYHSDYMILLKLHSKKEVTILEKYRAAQIVARLFTPERELLKTLIEHWDPGIRSEVFGFVQVSLPQRERPNRDSFSEFVQKYK